MSHSRFAPSFMPILVPCNGALKMGEGIPEVETEDSRNGTATHWVGEGMLNSLRSPETKTTSLDWVSQTAPNGVIITSEMYDAALTYFLDVAKTVNDFGLLNCMHTELPVSMPQIHPDCWGTPDCFVWDESRLTLYIWDFKYGHSSVSAYKNWQLLAYAVGILNMLTGGKALDENLNVRIKFTVTQPRCYDGQGPHRRWELDSIDLRSYVNQMNYACAMADSPDVKCVTGPQCKNCKGAHRCDTQLIAAVNAIDFSQRITIRDVTDVGLVYEMDQVEIAIDTLKNRLASLEADAESRIRKGANLPGRAMKETYGREKWKFPVEQMLSMGELLGVELAKPTELITPNQARQELKRNNVDESVINDYAMKSRSGTKLVKDDGSRAERIFSQEKL